MNLTERLVYLVIILFLVLAISTEYWWFVKHYDFLLEGFEIIWKNCKV